MKFKKILTVVVITLCVGFGLFYLFAYIVMAVYINGSREDFQSYLWKDDFEGERRTAMLYDLEKEHLKKGMTKDDIIKLLGEPDGRFPDGDNYTWKREFGYDLGNNGFDPCEFIIRFDENQRVVSWETLCS